MSAESAAGLPNPGRLLEEFLAFQRTLALRAALEMDLFTQIGCGADTIQELGEKCGVPERGMRILCDYLTVQGHLCKHEDRYSLPLPSRLYLTTASPAYIGSAVRFLASDEVVHSFCALRQAVQDGGASGEALLSGDSHWVEFARAMAPIANPVAHITAAALGVAPGQPIQVLDIGAGHGLYGVAVAARNPAAHIFALDGPNVLEVAERNARLAGVWERYHLIPGDAFLVEWGGPYDLVLIANLAHHLDETANIALFRKCRVALKPSGRMVLIDFIANDDRVSPATDAAFALTLLATTVRGDVYTFREFSRMLQAAGFLDVHRVEVGDLPQWIIAASG